ncbi:MAG: hypothetical protein ACOX8S_09615 [Christensenellales bacterium]
MSFYSYKNTNTDAMPGLIKGDSTKGLCERACVQVHKVYDSCLQQQQINNRDVEVTSLCAICCENDVTPVITPPITFESCRSATSKGILRNLTIDRLCDRPNFARVRGVVDIPIDILFTDANCQEGIGRGVISVEKDVLMYIPDESIVPFCIESLVSAICVSGSYRGDNVFRLTVCVTIILKIVAEVDLLIPTYGYCPVPPCEAFAENVCDEFFSLPIFPQTPGCSYAC